MTDPQMASIQYHRTRRRPPSAKYQQVLDAVTTEPLRATEIYRRWADIPSWKSLTRRHRNELKWLGRALQNLADDGHVIRELWDGPPRRTTFRREFARKGENPAAQNPVA